MEKISVFFASGFLSGFSKIAPGTCGSVVGSLIIYALWSLGFIADHWTLVILAVLISTVGYLSIKRLPGSWIHDDQRIVIDEVIGVFVSMCFIPISWYTLVLSLVLFRVFDIWKPLGIKSFDNRTSDVSVILDDVLAGIYANVTLQILIVLLPAI